MNFVMQPWQLLVFTLADWVQRQQQAIIGFQNEQIKALLELREETHFADR